MDLLLTPREVAARLRLSLRTLDRMRADGTGPPFVRVTPGARKGRVCYRESAVEAYIARRTITSTSDPGMEAA